mmetsp:Transcript_31683/g.101011  ORF Transcript_31683/g.101011 Transcript_31683/m.101011 type:complete len:207 (-) Transcript_31683:194-814(-)
MARRALATLGMMPTAPWAPRVFIRGALTDRVLGSPNLVVPSPVSTRADLTCSRQLHRKRTSSSFSAFAVPHGRPSITCCRCRAVFGQLSILSPVHLYGTIFTSPAAVFLSRWHSQASSQTVMSTPSLSIAMSEVKGSCSSYSAPSSSRRLSFSISSISCTSSLEKPILFLYGDCAGIPTGEGPTGLMFFAFAERWRGPSGQDLCSM